MNEFKISYFDFLIKSYSLLDEHYKELEIIGDLSEEIDES
jgi:hypothetical protein